MPDLKNPHAQRYHATMSSCYSLRFIRIRRQLYELVVNSANWLMEDEDELDQYFEAFKAISRPLVDSNVISRTDRNRMFWRGFHPDDRAALSPYLIDQHHICPGADFNFRDLHSLAYNFFAHRRLAAEAEAETRQRVDQVDQLMTRARAENETLNTHDEAYDTLYRQCVRIIPELANELPKPEPLPKPMQDVPPHSAPATPSPAPAAPNSHCPSPAPRRSPTSTDHQALPSPPYAVPPPPVRKQSPPPLLAPVHEITPPPIQSRPNAVSPPSPQGLHSTPATNRTPFSMCLQSLVPAPPPPAQPRSLPTPPLSPPPTSIPPPSPQPHTPPPQIHELAPPPPPSIAAAPPKPSEATEGKPNNYAQAEEIQSTRNGNASTTTRPEQVRVPSDHHNNPSDNTEGKQARDDTNGADLSSPSNSTNAGNRSSTPGAADNNDHSSSYGHNRTYDLGGPSNRNSRRVHDPGGNTLNNKDGVLRNDHSSSNSDIVFRAVNTHHIHSHDFVRTDAVPNIASSCASNNLPAILYLDAKCTKMQCPLPLGFSPTQASSILDATHTFIKKDTDNNNSGNSNINAASIPDLAHIPLASRSINNYPDIKSTLEFARANPISDATPLRSTDTLPAILPANSRTADATQCAPSPPSLQRVSHPLDFDHAQATTSDLTHTPPAPCLDNDNDDNRSSSNTLDAAHTSNNKDTTSLVSTARSLDTLDAGHTFNTSDANIAISRNINAANIISNACTNNANADTNSSSNNNNATSILEFDTATNNSDKKRSDPVDNSSARNVIRRTQPPSSPTSIAQAHIPTHSTTPTAATAAAATPVAQAHIPTHSTTPTAATAAATSVVQAHARHTINNDAVLTNDSNNNNCSNINAVGIINTRTRPISTSPTSISTAARDNESEPEDEDEHTRIPPLEVRTQIPPIVPPPPDKPEEPPPHSTRMDAIDNRSTSNIVRSNEPEHERARTPPLEVPLPTNKTPSTPNSQVTQTTRPPSPVMCTPFLAYSTTCTLASLAEDPVLYRQWTTSTANHTEKESTQEG